ncbi:phosphatase PAP2 family protein [Streptomyces sp. SID4950]|nr:phosphatase PAP2 family protein [Streptomyces sp. SID4950]
MGDNRSEPPQPRPGRALAHTPGVSGSGSPHRSDSRSPQTPRGGRRSGPVGRPGTTPPVPGRPTSSLLLGLLGLPALLLALITWQVVADGPLLRLDARVSAALRHPDRFSEILSDLGNVEVAVPVLAAVLVLAGLRRRSSGTDHWWLPSLAGAVATAVVPALVVPLKVWTDRPGTPAVPPATGYFPSGHTATAALAYGSAALVLLPLLRTPAARRAVVGAGAALVLAVSYGLVRRGYHWPLDVVASWCLATVLLTLLALALGRAGRTGRGGGAGPGQPK